MTTRRGALPWLLTSVLFPLAAAGPARAAWLGEQKLGGTPAWSASAGSRARPVSPSTGGTPPGPRAGRPG